MAAGEGHPRTSSELCSLSPPHLFLVPGNTIEEISLTSYRGPPNLGKPGGLPLMAEILSRAMQPNLKVLYCLISKGAAVILVFRMQSTYVPKRTHRSASRTHLYSHVSLPSPVPKISLLSVLETWGPEGESWDFSLPLTVYLSAVIQAQAL